MWHNTRAKNPVFALPLVLAVFALCVTSCSAWAYASLQDVGRQWAAIEPSLGRQYEVQPESSIIEAIDMFQATVRSFLDSGIYQALPPLSNPDFGVSAYGESPGIHALDGLALSLREAVLDEDREKALLVSADISGILVRTMLQEGEANRSLINMLYRLILILAVLFVLAIIVLQFFNKMLSRSFRNEEESAALSRAVLAAREEERGLLYRELSDRVIQDLCYLSMGMDRIVTADEKAERNSICLETQSIQSGIIAKVRDICDNLAPPEFGMRSLPDTLRQLCLDFGNRTGIECHMSMGENVGPGFTSEEQDLQIFRIVQEALANTEKHAAAGEVTVEMQPANGGGFSVTVSDNGKGFATGEGIRLGVREMMERAALLGGSLTVNSKRGKGTKVCLSLPPYSSPQTQVEPSLPTATV